MKKQEFSLRFIAKTMNRSYSTIRRELKRTYRHTDKNSLIYQPIFHISHELKRNTGKKGYHPKQANQFANARHSHKNKANKITQNRRDNWFYYSQLHKGL